jgi:hypothetical protein
MFLLVVILILGGTVFYVMTYGLTSPEPHKIKQVNLSLADYDMNLRGNNSGGSVDQIKKLALMNQRIHLEDQTEQNQLAQQQIEESIEEELNRLESKYSKKIAEKEEAIKERVDQFIEEKQLEYKERVMVKEEMLKSQLDKFISSLKEEEYQAMDQSSQKIMASYYNDILNLNLKLELINLTDEERKEYQDKLKGLKAEKSQQVKEMKDKLNRELKEKIATLEKDINQEYRAAQDEIKSEIESDIQAKKNELNNKLNKYIAAQKDIMEDKLQVKRTEMQKRKNKELDQKNMF